MIRVVKQATPTVAVGSNLSPSTIGQAVTFTATVGGISGFVPTGNVNFKQGADIVASVPLVNGQASYTTTFAKAAPFQSWPAIRETRLRSSQLEGDQAGG